MSSLEEQLAGLTPEQRAVLEKKWRERLARASGHTRIDRRPDPGVHDLSFAQQRLWFVEQLQPAGAAYHISAVVRLEGQLSYAALEASVSEILQRHEVLRVGFVNEQGRPIAKVAAAAACRIAVIDVPDDVADDVGDDRPESRLAAAHRLATRECERPFDLATGPMLRASLVRLSASDHFLVLVLHHIAADGWSVAVLGRELSALYQSHLRSTSSPLAALPIQYADFAAWQRTHVSGDRLSEQLGWWRQQLSDLSVIELPTDYPRPAMASLAGARESRLIRGELTQALAAIGQRQGATVFMTLLAAFQILLMRWTGQRDVAVGSPVAGRNWSEVEALIGLFVNTLVLRSNLAGDPTFFELLERVRITVTGALAHQDIPFERLVEELQVERTLSHAPLAAVFFAFQNVPPASLSLANLRVSAVDIERRSSRFDLSFFATETPGGLHVTIEYRSDLFEAATVRRVLECYERLVEALVRDPGQRIESLPMISAAERDQILIAWNRTAQPYSRRTTVMDLVAQQAAANPDAPAIVCGAARLSYGDLDRQSNQLARYLSRRGVSAEVLVAVCCGRGIPFVIAALGVLKAGGAYAPIDPKVPPGRLGHILTRARISLLLVESALDAPPSGWIGPIVEWSRERRSIADESPDALSMAVDPDQLAYVIHTSGSTGEPNGVAIAHGSLLNLVWWHRRVYNISAKDAAAQVASVGFDACVWELWPHLTAGAAVHIPDDETRDVPEKLWAWIADAAITTMFLPTPLAEAALREGLPESLALRTLLTGGDRLHHLPDVPLSFAFVNHYGPTESTVVTTCAPIVMGERTAPPIGRPIDNTRIYVLDSGREPVPIGVAGELYVGGDGLARGYAGAPALTADRFVPDPLSGVPGGRLYRTGDLVRYRDDGALEFLGRRDHQVKIRGHRIELGEIESVLARHPLIAAAAASILGSASGPTLVAHIVGAGGAAPREEEVRAFLKERLPDYMVPAKFVRLDSLPLTRNGKVDRAALPAPDFGSSNATAFVAPRNDVEEIVVAACRELLGVPVVSVFDNFFDLGGHSLLVTQLASKLKRVCHADISIRMIFESRTLAELADAIVDKMLDEPGDAMDSGK